MLSKSGNPDLEIIAYHGWGFSSEFWNPWKDVLPDNVSLKTADRGYYFDETHPEFSQSPTLKILFLHSFGLHWCPHKQIESADVIAVFNGFMTFHPTEKKAHAKSVKFLDRTISAFSQYPEEVLKQFRINTFFPDDVIAFPHLKLNKERLLTDLKLLHTSSFDTNIITPETLAVCVDGGRDKVLGIPRGAEICKQLEHSIYHFVKEAGHALPSTHSADCWSFLNAMIHIFRRNGNYREYRHQ